MSTTRSFKTNMWPKGVINDGFERSVSMARMQAKLCRPSQFIAHEPQMPYRQDLLRLRVESRLSLMQRMASRYIGGIFLRSMQQLTYFGLSSGSSGLYLQTKNLFMLALSASVKLGLCSTMQLLWRKPLTVVVTLSKNTLLSGFPRFSECPEENRNFPRWLLLNTLVSIQLQYRRVVTVCIMHRLKMKQQALQEALSLILQKSVSCFRKVLVNQQTYIQLQQILVDFESVDELLTIVINLTQFMDNKVEHELKTGTRQHEIRYRELETHLQKQQQLNRNIVKRELQLRENLQIMQMQLNNLQHEVLKLKTNNQQLSKTIEQNEIQRQRILNQRTFQLCQRDLMINKLEQSLGMVQSDPNQKTVQKNKVKQHHRRKSDEPIRLCNKEKKILLVQKIKK